MTSLRSKYFFTAPHLATWAEMRKMDKELENVSAWILTNYAALEQAISTGAYNETKSQCFFESFQNYPTCRIDLKIM